MVTTKQLTHSEVKSTASSACVCVWLDDVLLPANVGSLFRMADALGVSKLYLSGNTPVPPNRLIRKTSRATEQTVPYELMDDALAGVKKLKAQGVRVVSLEITDASMDVKDFIWDKQDKLCLILGNEKKGVAQELLDLSDACVHIPMRGNNSSMNVAMAAALAVYELMR